MQVTLYRVDSGFRNVQDGLTLVRPDSSTIYTEAVYDLPEGFEVAVDDCGQPHIYGPDGLATPAPVGRFDRGGVMLVTAGGDRIGLRRVGERPAVTLRTARLAAGLTQTQVAQAAGITTRQLQRAEQDGADPGTISARTLLTICDLLDLDIHEIL